MGAHTPGDEARVQALTCPATSIGGTEFKLARSVATRNSSAARAALYECKMRAGIFLLVLAQGMAGCALRFSSTRLCLRHPDADPAVTAVFRRA